MGGLFSRPFSDRFSGTVKEYVKQTYWQAYTQALEAAKASHNAHPALDWNKLLKIPNQPIDYTKIFPKADEPPRRHFKKEEHFNTWCRYMVKYYWYERHWEIWTSEKTKRYCQQEQEKAEQLAIEVEADTHNQHINLIPAEEFDADSDIESSQGNSSDSDDAGTDSETELRQSVKLYKLRASTLFASSSKQQPPLHSEPEIVYNTMLNFGSEANFHKLERNLDVLAVKTVRCEPEARRCQDKNRLIENTKLGMQPHDEELEFLGTMLTQLSYNNQAVSF